MKRSIYPLPDEAGYNCHNCCEALSYDGPMGNGDPDSYVVFRTGSTAYLFCSEACFDWWLDVSGLGNVGDGRIGIVSAGG